MIIKCNECGDTLIGDNKGTFISCSCGQHYIDQTPYYVRIGGNNFEEIDREVVLKQLLNKIKKNSYIVISGDKYYKVTRKTADKFEALNYDERVILADGYYFKGE